MVEEKQTGCHRPPAILQRKWGKLLRHSEDDVKVIDRQRSARRASTPCALATSGASDSGDCDMSCTKSRDGATVAFINVTAQSSGRHSCEARITLRCSGNSVAPLRHPILWAVLTKDVTISTQLGVWLIRDVGLRCECQDRRVDCESRVVSRRDVPCSVCGRETAMPSSVWMKRVGARLEQMSSEAMAQLRTVTALERPAITSAC